MKKAITGLFIFISLIGKSQTIDSIYVHLYTDSLKKGTYNYINIDGLLSNGRYQPLDSSSIIFWASDGKFYGNSLVIDKDFKKPKITIKVALRKNPALSKEFIMYIKTKADEEHLKTTEELMNELNNSRSKKSNKSSTMKS